MVLPVANRKAIPYSSGKSFRLVAVYAEEASAHVTPRSGESSCSTEALAGQASRSVLTRSARSCSPPQVGNPDPEDSVRIIHKALDAGINLVNTADAYGDSEEVVGRALKGRRDNVVLATKVGRPMGTDPNHQGASRRWIITAVENSLRRLQTDHIDVYQIHRPDPGTDIRGNTVCADRPRPQRQDPRVRHLDDAT